VSKRTLQDYIARGCPKGPVAAINKWRASSLAPTRSRRGESDGDPTLADLVRRKIEQEIRGKKLRCDQLEGRFVLRDDAIQAINALCLRLKSRMEAWPNEVEMLLPPDIRAAVKRELAEKVALTLREIAQWEI
jgi:hypothetical protein